MIICVFPGVPDVLAKPAWRVSILMSEDLPTLERPMKAYSGLSGLGQSDTSGLLIMYLAETISMEVVQLHRNFATMQATQKYGQVVPDANSNLGKKAQVADMFNHIAGNYDFLNHFLSLGIDKVWRKRAIREVGMVGAKNILDVATGTGDLAIAANALNPDQIMGIDIADQMLEVGRKKLDDLGLNHKISLHTADSECIPYPSDTFDAVMCAYGVRNFEHLEAGLKEMLRVLKPGGKVVILEFSQPTAFPIKQLYKFYFRYILPVLGRVVSKHGTAYTYLPESVSAFPQGKEFTEVLMRCGYSRTVAKPLTLGVTSLYTAFK